MPLVFVVAAGAHHVQKDAADTELGDVSLHRSRSILGYVWFSFCSRLYRRKRVKTLQLAQGAKLSPEAPRYPAERKKRALRAGDQQRIEIEIVRTVRAAAEVVEGDCIWAGTAGQHARFDHG
jgi:hypothetical protein